MHLVRRVHGVGCHALLVLLLICMHGGCCFRCCWRRPPLPPLLLPLLLLPLLLPLLPLRVVLPF